MILSHQILLALISYAIKEIQEWTKSSIPSGAMTYHDFKDGQGPVPAVPFDTDSFRNDVIKTILFPINVVTSSFRNDIMDTTEYKVNSVHSSFRNEVVTTLKYPIHQYGCGLRNDIIECIAI